jgi:hypothetical protein
MIINNIQEEFNQIDEGSSNQVVLDLINYIEETLPGFRDSREFVDILKKKKNEDQHSTAFCVYMTNKCKSTYCFTPENSQKGSYKIDFGIYQGSILIFTIEAKLLPTPKGTKNKPRAEHEYVYGKGAGIQRFRDGFHGVDNQDNPLPENGMIAYIKEQDVEYWFSKVNQWVLEAQWDKSEQLEKIYFKQIARLRSKHPRQNASEVILHHFWIDVASKQSV